jgi:mono/diheme cytochrome c family protein
VIRMGSDGRTSISTVIPAAVAAIAVLGWTFNVVAQSSTARSRTVSDGVFTLDQAKRGESTYLDECGRCHTETLAGGDFGPPVVGTAFWDEWKGKTAADLFELMRTTMPQDNPGRLSASQTADVLAFLMKSNGFPAGDAPLSPEPSHVQSNKLEPAH